MAWWGTRILVHCLFLTVREKILRKPLTTGSAPTSIRHCEESDYNNDGASRLVNVDVVVVKGTRSWVCRILTLLDPGAERNCVDDIQGQSRYETKIIDVWIVFY